MPERLRRGLRMLAFILGYVGLERLSLIEPLHGLDITSWNPVSALALLYLLRHRAQGLLPVLAAIFASYLTLHTAGSGLAESALMAMLLTIGYGSFAAILGWQFPDGGLFGDRDGLLRWCAIVIVAALVNGVVVVSGFAVLALLPWADWAGALLRYWIADAVGIFVGFPLLSCLQDAERRRRFMHTVWHGETAAYLLFALFMLWLAFDPANTGSYKYFFTLSLPLVWAASRQGLRGAILGATALQLGMILGDQWQGAQIALFDLQLRAFVLALVGYFIGVAVDEQRRTEGELRKSLRLAAAGEMAAALAHELNQPLAALTAYGAACEKLVAQGTDDRRLRAAVQQMTAQAGRAAEIVHRLRDFFRTGSTHLECFPLADLVDAAMASMANAYNEAGIAVELEPLPPLLLEADRLQLEVVLRNLLGNAVDAVAAQAPGQRRIALGAAVEADGRLCIRVVDSGPGIAATALARLFEPFASTKASGLGLGLAISRAIAEAHGGALVAEVGDHGCFKLYLPVTVSTEPAHG